MNKKNKYILIWTSGNMYFVAMKHISAIVGPGIDEIKLLTELGTEG
jgi:hypothetical protein